MLASKTCLVLKKEADMAKESSDTAVSLWKELKKYLTTNTKISSPRIANPRIIKEIQFRNETVVDIEIIVSNTAPL